MRFLFQPIDIATLAFFRIAFGVLGFVDIVGTILHKETRENLSQADFHFKYAGFEWIPAPPEWVLWILAVLMLIWSAGIALGYYYKWCMTLFALAFSYLFLIEATQYLNHGYLFAVMGFLMIFLPANRCFSLDAQRNPELYSDTTARWHTWILAFLMGVVYFYGGLAKLNGDWLHAQPLKIWLKAKQNLFLIGDLISQEWVAWAMSYGGVALDLLAVPLLLFKRTRWIIFVFILSFHFINTLIFQIGIFPLLSIALTLLYFSPDWPRRLVYRFFKKYKASQLSSPFRLRSMQAFNGGDHEFQEKDGSSKPILFLDNYQMPGLAKQRWITGVLLVFCLYHLLMPLRHHLIPDHVAWTEEGHRYSWRMMLRGKSTNGYLLVKDKDTGKEWRETGSKHLTKRQKRKMRSNPELILQYAHYLRDVYKKEGQDVAVYSFIKAGLNGRKRQLYLDSTVDLTQETYPLFGRAEWIEPIVW